MSEIEQSKRFVSAEECHELAEAMQAKYALAAGARRFHVEAVEKDRGVYVKVLLANADESFFYPVEARILAEVEELSAREAVFFLIDYLDMYFEEFLIEEDEALYLPIDWSDHEWDAVKFQVRGQILNRKLERMADELLGKDFSQ